MKEKSRMLGAKILNSQIVALNVIIDLYSSIVIYSESFLISKKTLALHLKNIPVLHDVLNEGFESIIEDYGKHEESEKIAKLKFEKFEEIYKRLTQIYTRLGEDFEPEFTLSSMKEFDETVKKYKKLIPTNGKIIAEA